MDFQKCQRQLTSKLDIFKDNQEIEDQLDGLNVEDGLSAQDNETFLLASMAFLQQHAKRKLGVINEHAENDCTSSADSQRERKKFKRTYSNMLLFETAPGDNGQKERFYLKLKNSEKYYNVIKSETCFEPNNILSQEQIFPGKVKNPKKFPKLFRSLSKTKSNKRNIDSLSPKSSIFNLFKSKHKKIRLDSKLNSIELCPQEEIHFGKDWSWEIKRKCHQTPPRDEELKLISELHLHNNHETLKNSINQKLRVKTSESLTTVQKFLLDDKPCSKNPNQRTNEVMQKPPPKMMCHEYYYVDRRQPKPKKISRPLSKISVCYEEDSDSDYLHWDNNYEKEEMEVNNLTQSQMSGFSNISDELKANLSPEILQNIISEMIVYLEDVPNYKGV